MSANIPYLNERLRIRRRVIIRANQIEMSWNSNLKRELGNEIREIINEYDELSRLMRVRFR